jgi:hypothetical protein
LLAYPPEVDLSVSQRLGFHVVARLAQRHKIDVSLTPTPGTGLTAVVVLPPELFVSNRAEIAARHVGPARHAIPPAGPPPRTRAVMPSPSGGWSRSSRPVPRQSWRPMSAESMSPESPAADLSELAEIAVDQLNAAGSDSRERWDGWWAAEPFPLRNGNRNMPDSGAANLGPRPSMEGSSEPGGAGNFVATDVPPRAADNGAAARVPELNRRRPQSHLSPELLKPRPTPYKRDRPEIPDPRPTSEALSRYQASRQAAQSEGRQTGQPTTGGAR